MRGTHQVLWLILAIVRDTILAKISVYRHSTTTEDSSETTDFRS